MKETNFFYNECNGFWEGNKDKHSPYSTRIVYPTLSCGALQKNAMSHIEADRLAIEKLEADKKAAEDAAAATAAAASAWATGRYNSIISLLLFSVIAMLALYIDVSAISVACACVIQYQHVVNFCQCHASDLSMD